MEPAGATAPYGVRRVDGDERIGWRLIIRPRHRTRTHLVRMTHRSRAPAMIKVLTVFGTRPEAIKLAPVIKELERRSDRFDAKVCVTGQHRELMDQMLDLFGIRPDYDFDVMSYDQSPSDVTVAVLSGLGEVLRAEQPDWVLVQGDTTTTMAGGLGAFYHGCRIAHVEAGLPTFDQRAPWPEEMNRRAAGGVAALPFAPT